MTVVVISALSFVFTLVAAGMKLPIWSGAAAFYALANLLLPASNSFEGAEWLPLGSLLAVVIAAGSLQYLLAGEKKTEKEAREGVLEAAQAAAVSARAAGEKAVVAEEKAAEVGAAVSAAEGEVLKAEAEAIEAKAAHVNAVAACNGAGVHEAEAAKARREAKEAKAGAGAAVAKAEAAVVKAEAAVTDAESNARDAEQAKREAETAKAEAEQAAGKLTSFIATSFGQAIAGGSKKDVIRTLVLEYVCKKHAGVTGLDRERDPATLMSNTSNAEKGILTIARIEAASLGKVLAENDSIQKLLDELS